jgi:hypothetical protein
MDQRRIGRRPPIGYGLPQGVIGPQGSMQMSQVA